jgi:hypothetical protein
MKTNEAILMVVKKVRNAFEVNAERGRFTIKDGQINLSEEYMTGEWVAIVGSVLNNGIYKIEQSDQDTLLLRNGTDSDSPVTDEVFTGAVWRLRLPKDFIRVCDEIREWHGSPQAKPSNVASENVVGFYSKTVATGKDGVPAGWDKVFASKINDNWCKMFESRLVSSL